MSACVVGVGNAFRGDDGVGLEVVRLLEGVRTFECEGEPVSLLDTWTGFERVFVVDAMQSGAAPGTVRRIDVGEEPLPDDLRGPSTHLLGIGEAVELARALGRLPRQLVLYGIEGARWDTGAELSPPVAAAALRVAADVEREVRG